MKKIVMLFAAAFCFAAVQGASLSWTISQVKTPTDSSVAGAGYSVYLFATKAGGAVAYETTTVDAVKASIDKGTFEGGITKGKLSDVGAATGDTGLGNVFGAGDSISAFAVIFDGDYDAKNGGNYIITDEKSASWTSPSGAKTLIYGSQAKAVWTAYGTGPVTPTPTPTVPEPTSGLLLALGGAALALRRKQK